MTTNTCQRHGKSSCKDQTLATIFNGVKFCHLAFWCTKTALTAEMVTASVKTINFSIRAAGAGKNQVTKTSASIICHYAGAFIHSHVLKFAAFENVADCE
jgi:hypothetical protein